MQPSSKTIAVGVASLAADSVVRVDGRPVPRDQVPQLVGAHRESVKLLVGYHGTISVAGLRTTFEPDRRRKLGTTGSTRCPGDRNHAT
jgi:hypothetical protein